MKKSKKYLLSLFMFVILGLGALQANPPGGGGGGDDGEGAQEDPTVPIDGGISILLVAGAAYGVKKVLDKKQ